VDTLDRAGFVRRAGAVTLGPAAVRLSTLGRAGPATGLPSPLDELQRSIHGTVVGRTTPGYDRARELYNTRFDSHRPLAVVYVQSAGDVQQTIAWARKHRILNAPRGGGHSYGGYSSVPGGVVVDVSRLASVALSAGGRATVGAGAKLFDVYTTLAQHGVTIPAGSCPTVGVGGQVLGGGVGFLSRKLGTTSDNLLSLQLVTADGEVRTCSPTENPDLYWASRGGGGGNFGVATQYTFRTSPISSVSTFTAEWRWSQAKGVVAAWQDWAPHAPDELFSVVNLSGNGGSPTVRVSGQLVGTPARLHALLGPFVSKIAPETLVVKPRLYIDAVHYWAGCASDCRIQPAGKLPRATFAAKSDYVRRPLPPGAAAVIVSAIARAPGSGTLLLDSYGGAVNRVPKAATAFVHRDMLCSLQYLSYWGAPPQSAASLAWLRAFSAAMRPYVSGESYVNYIDPDLAGRPQAYYGSNLARLVSIKKRFDPGNVFRFRQSIPLRL
jgi:FAD/FMN-containing dehydrogenase